MLCQKASAKMGVSGGWYNTKWNDNELVMWKGGLYVPIDYGFGFCNGLPTHKAIIRDIHAYNSIVHVRLSEIEYVND